VASGSLGKRYSQTTKGIGEEKIRRGVGGRGVFLVFEDRRGVDDTTIGERESGHSENDYQLRTGVLRCGMWRVLEVGGGGIL